MTWLTKLIDWFTGDSDIKEPPPPVPRKVKDKIRPEYDTFVVRNDFEMSWGDLEYELGRQIEFVQVSRLRNNKRSFKYKIFSEKVTNEHQATS